MTLTGSVRAERTVTAAIWLSLDGRVNGPGGEDDMTWMTRHAATDTARDHMVNVTSAATTVLLGRRNYQRFSSFWPAVAHDDQADPTDRAFARWLDAVEKIVFTPTLGRPGWRNARIAADDPAGTVRQLRRQDGGDIIVLASASIIRGLLEAGEVDRLAITLCPELIGGTGCLFGDGPAGSSWVLAGVAGTETGAACLVFDRIRPGAGPAAARPRDRIRRCQSRNPPAAES